MYEQQLIGLKTQKIMYEELIAKCLNAKKYLMNIFPTVYLSCRKDVEAINEVYDMDEEIEDILELVREKDN